MTDANEKTKSEVGLGFPGKLYEILEAEPSINKGIEWSTDGDAICIFPERFNACESKQHFQGTLYGSFTRRLYRYGFDRLVMPPSSNTNYPDGAHIYRNGLFRRGRPDLLKAMKVDNKRLYRKAIRQKNPGTEPPKECPSERTSSGKILTSDRPAMKQSPVTNSSSLITEQLRQALMAQNQLNAARRSVNSSLHLDSFLIAALSNLRNAQIPSGTEQSNATPIQNAQSSVSSQRVHSEPSPIFGSMTGAHNSAPLNSSLIDSQLLELLRLQYRR